MKFLQRVALFVVLVSCAGQSAAEEMVQTVGVPDPVPSWRIIANSDLIVVGNVSTPGKDIDVFAEAKKKRDYVYFTVKIHRVLLGQDPGPSVLVRVTSEEGLNQVRSRDGLECIAFLERQDRVDWNLYGKGETAWFLAYPWDVASLVPASDNVIEMTNKIIARHERWLHSPLPATDPEVDDQVKLLIEDMVKSRESQFAAFEKLEALGMRAVPSMIHLMDDRRLLASPSISLANYSPAAFEAIRHYGPEVVLEALAAILNQITDEDFGFIYNGSSNFMRDHAVRGWRLYAHYLAQHESGPIEE